MSQYKSHKVKGRKANKKPKKKKKIPPPYGQEKGNAIQIRNYNEIRSQTLQIRPKILKKKRKLKKNKYI